MDLPQKREKWKHKSSVLYFTSLNSTINDKFNTKIRLTDTFESSNKLVKVFYGSKDSFTPLQPFLPWGFANFEPFTCLPKVNNVCNNIILQIEHFQDLKKTKNCAVPSETTQDLVNLASVPFPWSLAVHHRSVAFRVRLCEIRSSWGKGWIKAASLDFAAQSFWFQVMILYISQDNKLSSCGLRMFQISTINSQLLERSLWTFKASWLV